MALALSKKQEEEKKFKISEQLKEHLAKRVRQAMWEPQSAGVWYKPGEAASSSPPSHSTQLALPAPAKAGFTVGSTPPPSSYYRSSLKEPPKSLMNAVTITPMKPNMIQATPPPPKPKPKFNIRARLTPEEKAERKIQRAESLRLKREERTRKKNIESVKKKERTKKEELANNLKATGENAQDETTRTRSVRRKN